MGTLLHPPGAKGKTPASILLERGSPGRGRMKNPRQGQVLSPYLVSSSPATPLLLSTLLLLLVGCSSTHSPTPTSTSIPLPWGIYQTLRGPRNCPPIGAPLLLMADKAVICYLCSHSRIRLWSLTCHLRKQSNWRMPRWYPMKLK